jgi:hypothetical protein
LDISELTTPHGAWSRRPQDYDRNFQIVCTFADSFNANLLRCCTASNPVKRRVRPGLWSFIGTDEEAEAIRADGSDLFQGGDPLPHVAHLSSG